MSASASLSDSAPIDPEIFLFNSKRFRTNSQVTEQTINAASLEVSADVIGIFGGSSFRTHFVRRFFEAPIVGIQQYPSTELVTLVNLGHNDNYDAMDLQLTRGSKNLLISWQKGKPITPMWAPWSDGIDPVDLDFTVHQELGASPTEALVVRLQP
jgi:hypothetical protein